MRHAAITRRTMLAGAAALAAAPAAAALASKLLDQRWTKTGAGGDPDYAAWAEFLWGWRRMGSDGVARVDYAGAQAAGARAPLAAWLETTQKTDPTTLAPGAAMAWWINLYNAKTVEVVLAAWPVTSILKIDGGLFNTGPWDEARLTVNGAALSLDDVEHGILRPVWRDARVHYAVNCASIGCPDLAAAPWRATDLDARLDAAARGYVNHPRGARVEANELIVSKIYDWFEADFGGSADGVIAHLRTYADDGLRAQLADARRIGRTEYDWAVNAA